MTKLKRLATAATIATLALAPLLTGCSGGGNSASAAADCTPKWGSFPTIDKGKLELTQFDGMPYLGQAADGGYEGIDADFLTQFAKDSCLEPVWTVNPAAAVIQSVASGRADVAGGWYATAERAKIVNQTDPVYLELPTILAKNNPTANVQDLKGKPVGTVTGYAWVDDMKKIASDLKEYQSTDAVLADLTAGRIDYAVLGGIDAPYLAKTNAQFKGIEAKTMSPDPAVQSSVNPSLPNYPHTKGNDQLTKALNAAVADAHTSGRFAEIVKKYGLDPAIVNVSKFKQ